MTRRFVGAGGRTSTGGPGVDGLMAGNGLVGAVGRMGGTGCPRTDGGGFGVTGTGNTGAIRG